MYYQLRIATEEDVPAINAFLEKGQAKGGVTLAERTAFVVMEDADGQLAGCLGLEQFNEQEGLLRSLVISDKLGQGHIVSLFQSVQTLGEKWVWILFMSSQTIPLPMIFGINGLYAFKGNSRKHMELCTCKRDIGERTGCGPAKKGS